MKSICPLCGARKARRACPGVSQEICTVCCGTKRLAEIRCPADCVYLTTARAHPAAVVQRQQERDMAFVLPRIKDLTEPQYRLFLFVQAHVLQHATTATPPLRDRDAAEAAAAVAGTFETSQSGIIYEHQAASIPAQRLAAVLGKALTEFMGRSGSQASRIERDAAVALRRIERLAREAEAESPAPENPGASWLGIAFRMMGPTAAAEAQAPAAQGEPRIILP